jgi:hypothetical protein
MKINIKELSKINLEKGDVLIMKTEQRPSTSVGNMLCEMFPNNKVIIACHTDTFEIIKQELLK